MNSLFLELINWINWQKQWTESSKHMSFNLYSLRSRLGSGGFHGIILYNDWTYSTIDRMRLMHALFPLHFFLIFRYQNLRMSNRLKNKVITKKKQKRWNLSYILSDGREDVYKTLDLY